MPFHRFGDVGGAAGGNPDLVYEDLGAPVQLQGGGSSNSLGEWFQIGTPAQDLAELALEAYLSSNNSHRFLIDLSLDGSTVYVPEIFVQPETAGGATVAQIPMHFPGGAPIWARARTSGGLNTTWVTATGIRAGPGVAPGFTIAERVTPADPANTRASTVTATLTGGTGYVEIEDATANAYGALLVMLGEAAVFPATSQAIRATLGRGAPGSEVPIRPFTAMIRSGHPVAGRCVAPVARHAVPQSERLAMRIKAGTPGTDALAVGVLGFR